jgi:hypothetical protein
VQTCKSKSPRYKDSSGPTKYICIPKKKTLTHTFSELRPSKILNIQWLSVDRHNQIPLFMVTVYMCRYIWWVRVCLPILALLSFLFFFLFFQKVKTLTNNTQNPLQLYITIKSNDIYQSHLNDTCQFYVHLKNHHWIKS